MPTEKVCPTCGGTKEERRCTECKLSRRSFWHLPKKGEKQVGAKHFHQFQPCPNDEFHGERDAVNEATRVYAEHHPTPSVAAATAPPSGGEGRQCPKCGEKDLLRAHCHPVRRAEVDEVVCETCGHSWQPDAGTPLDVEGLALFEALDKLEVLAYCDECSPPDSTHPVGDDGVCLRHGGFTKEVVRSKLAPLASRLATLEQQLADERADRKQQEKNLTDAVAVNFDNWNIALKAQAKAESALAAAERERDEAVASWGDANDAFALMEKSRDECVLLLKALLGKKGDLHCLREKIADYLKRKGLTSVLR